MGVNCIFAKIIQLYRNIYPDHIYIYICMYVCMYVYALDPRLALCDVINIV